MSERDFEFQGRKFKLNKINAMNQFHIVRRIAPILGDLAPVIAKMSKTKTVEAMSEDERMDQMAKFVTPVMNGLSRLSDQDANMVLMGLVGAVEMQQQTGNWAKLAVNGNLMFDDIELPVLLNAAGRAFMFNMSGFFAVLPQVS